MTAKRVAAFVGYLACIVAANAVLNEWGMVVVLGTMLPAGVWFAGASFTVRDILDDLGGRRWVLAAIVAGGLVSYLFAPSFALASGVSFLVSESFDWAVYSPLRQRHRWVAIVLSNVVGSTVDSLLFLHLAFHSTNGWLALTVAKAIVTAPFLVGMWLWRRR